MKEFLGCAMVLTWAGLAVLAVMFVGMPTGAWLMSLGMPSVLAVILAVVATVLAAQIGNGLLWFFGGIILGTCALVAVAVSEALKED